MIEAAATTVNQSEINANAAFSLWKPVFLLITISKTDHVMKFRDEHDFSVEIIT